MADTSLLNDDFYLARNSQDELFTYLLSEDTNLPSLSSPSLSSPSASSSESSPSFSQHEMVPEAISYEDQLAFNQLWSELSAYGSNAEDPQAFAQSLLNPLQDSEEFTPESSPEVEEASPENPKKRKRIRKRTKKEEGPFAPTAVSLPREKLLVLTSKEMQQYVDDIRKTRPLTAEEERDIKRQKRLIKNRESALASRTRKKAHVEVLQQQLNEIALEKEEMKAGLDTLAKENEGLKQQVHHLQNVIRKTSFLSELWERMTNHKRQQLQRDPSSTTATATACLFVILFTFGLFFDPSPSKLEKPSLADAFANGVTSFVEEATPSIVSSASVSSNPENYPSFRTHRKLLETDELEDLLSTTTTTTTTTTSTSTSSSSSSSTSSSSSSSSSASTPSTTSTTSTTSTWTEDDDMRKPLNGSNYFLCSTPHHVSITPPSSTLSDNNNNNEEGSSTTLPSLVTFFLPADVVRQTMLALASQVSCQMLDAATIARFTALAAAASTSTTTSSSHLASD